MFYSWDEKQPFARDVSRYALLPLAPPPPPPLIYMEAERAERSLLHVDWDVDKPRRRAENLDRWRPLRAMLALRRIMKSSNTAISPPKNHLVFICLSPVMKGMMAQDVFR